MKAITNRQAVYIKDVMRITGQSSRNAQRLLKKIKRLNNKEYLAYVSLQDFCAYTGFKEDAVKQVLQ